MPLARSRLLPVARAGLRFDGVTQYASVPSFTFPQVFTVVLSVKAYPKVVASYEWAFHHRYPGVWYGTVSLTVEADLGAIFRIHGTDGAEHWVGAPSFYDEGVFTHVAVQHDGSRMRMFKNGVLVRERSVPVLPQLRTDELRIFTHGGGDMHINMIASSFLIYSRALSDEEIQWNYYYPDNPVRNGLVLWLHYDTIDTDRGVWYDKSGFGNHARLYNGPVKEDVLLPPKRLLSPTRTLTPVR